MSLETTTDSRVEQKFRKQNAEIIKKYSKESHFNPIELEALSLIYFKIFMDCKSKSNQIQRSQFRLIFTECFQITDDFLIDRAFFALDGGTSAYVTLETWLETMSLFLRGTLKEKINYCFKVYDTRGDKIIRKKEMLMLMAKSFDCLPDKDAELAVRDLVDMIIKKMDLDADGAISFDDYRETVLETPAMLECLGQCLPERESAFVFLATFTDMYSNRF